MSGDTLMVMGLNAGGMISDISDFFSPSRPPNSMEGLEAVNQKKLLLLMDCHA